MKQRTYWKLLKHVLIHQPQLEFTTSYKHGANQRPSKRRATLERIKDRFGRTRYRITEYNKIGIYRAFVNHRQKRFIYQCLKKSGYSPADLKYITKKRNI